MKSYLHMFFTAALLITGFLSSACNEIKEIPVSNIYNSNNCGIKNESFTIIKDNSQLQKIIDKSNSFFITETSSKITDISFNKNYVMLFSIGQKGSAAYKIKTIKSSADLINKNVFLPVKSTLPETGKNYAQLLTSPCYIFSIPKGDYKKIIINEHFFIEISH